MTSSPGEFPFRRGIKGKSEVNKVWTMRQYAGFASVEQANLRFKKLINQGATGLSVAFDLPTQLGLDSDNPMSQGEVGRVGVSINHLGDMRRLFDGIDLRKVSTSMTINATAPILLLMYELIALEKGIGPAEIRGTIQNDLLKEFIARGNYIFSPQKSLEISTLTSLYCIKNLPKWNHISVSGYHMAEAGAKPSQEIGFALSNAIQHIHSLKEYGVTSDEACARVSFFFTSTTRLLEQIAKFRAAREVWAELCLSEFQLKDVNNAKLKFHTQTAGVELLAKDPILNVSRVTIQALGAILGGTQSLHTNGFDEALELPSEKSAIMALNIQRILAEETDLTDFIDALGNSDVIEELTDKMAQEIRGVIKEINLIGGALKATENGFQKNLIEKNAFQEFLEVEDGSRSKIYSTSPIQAQMEASERVAFGEIELEIVAELNIWKSRRDLNEVKVNLNEITACSDKPENLMHAIKKCLISGATIGEISLQMKSIWGTHDQEYR